MKYEFVQVGKWKEFDSIDEIPYKVVGYTKDLSEERKKGMLVRRAELDNQPIYEGFLTPMWNGGNIRYETVEVYDMYYM